MEYNIDMKNFWEVNRKCTDLSGKIPRVPVSIHLDGDWICDFLKLDNARYYSDFEYQQEQRLRCSEITKKELDYTIYPAVDFGVVMDASVYGGQVNYESKATPTLRPVVNEPEEIDYLIEKMNKVDILEQGLVPKYLEWRERIRMRYGIELSYGNSLKGCATMLGQVCGITNFLTWIMTDPEQIQKLADCWLEITKKYISALRKATGFDESCPGFSFYSDVAGMLSPQLYIDFMMEREKSIYDLYASDSQDTRFYHADSHMLHHLDTLREMGVNQVNVDPYIDPSQILQKMPDVIVFGQIPPTKVLLYGTPDEVVECARRDILQAGAGKHLILCTAGSINPGTAFENLRAMFYAAEKFGYIY